MTIVNLTTLTNNKDNSVSTSLRCNALFTPLEDILEKYNDNTKKTILVINFGKNKINFSKTGDETDNIFSINSPLYLYIID